MKIIRRITTNGEQFRVERKFVQWKIEDMLDRLLGIPEWRSSGVTYSSRGEAENFLRIMEKYDEISDDRDWHPVDAT